MLVVDLGEGVEQGLQLGEGSGLSGLGAEPLLEGLLEPLDLALGLGMVRLAVLLRDVELAELVLEVVTAGGATEEPDGEDAAVVGQRGRRQTMCGNGCAEGREHDRAGDRPVRGDRQGVAGAVVQPREDLDVGAFLEAPDAPAVGDMAGAVGEAVVGEVGLPGLVRLGGFEPDVGVLRSLLGLGVKAPAPVRIWLRVARYGVVAWRWVKCQLIVSAPATRPE